MYHVGGSGPLGKGAEVVSPGSVISLGILLLIYYSQKEPIKNNNNFIRSIRRLQGCWARNLKPRASGPFGTAFWLLERFSACVYTDQDPTKYDG